MQGVLLVGLLGLAFLAIEQVAPARPLPRVPGYWARAIGLNLAQVLIALLAGLAWDRWLGGLHLVDLSGWGPLGGGLAAYGASCLVFYAWHRARHEVPWLWRTFHQLHHSPARLEVTMAFYKHPSELLANAVLSSAVAYGLLGVTPEAGAVYTALTGAAELFYHWNVRTPRWLGWIIQRPEMHRLHHERGRHRSNYADLPLIDLLFGTFENPPDVEVECGFEAGRERELASMLRGEDVLASLPAAARYVPSRRPAAPASAAAVAALGLFGLGTLQMSGDLLGLPAVRALGATTCASPAPKVFTDVRGFETFSADFTLEATARDGRVVRVALDPALNARVQGPYNRRNVYGAALAYGPRLPAPLLDQVLDHAFHEPGTLAKELGLPGDLVAIRVEAASRTRGREDQRFVHERRWR